jgi:hypothetical protein
MSQRDVDQFRDELLRRRFADEQPDLFERVGHPREENKKRNEDSSQGIYKPSYAASNDGQSQPESIHDNIVSMVDLTHVRLISLSHYYRSA